MSSTEQSSELFSANPEDLQPNVLCYPFPEVRDILGSLRLPEEFHKRTLPAEAGRRILVASGYPDLEIPADIQGFVDLEAIHIPVIDRITKRNESLLDGLSGFEHAYPVPGSSLSIRTLMTEWFDKGTMTELAIIDDEYDGYEWNADILRIPKHRVRSLQEAGEPKKGRVWFLSNPSATDGNWHDSEVLQAFIEAGHDVVIDAAYSGLEPSEHPFDVSAPNIKAVLTSPSKIFGVFRHRLTGVTYTREQVDSLIDSQLWFKDIPATMDSLALYESFGPHELPRLYREWQRIICDAISELIGKEFIPSDTILFAHSDDIMQQEYSHFALASGRSRIRLTTLYERLEEFKMAKDNTILKFTNT